MTEQYKSPDRNYDYRLGEPKITDPVLSLKTDMPAPIEPVIQHFVYNYLPRVLKNQELTYKMLESFDTTTEIKIGDRILFTVHYANSENCGAFNITANIDTIRETVGLKKKKIMKILENYGRILHKNVPFDIGADSIDSLIRKLRRKNGVEVVENEDGWKIDSLYIGGGQFIVEPLANIVRSESGFQFVPIHQFGTDGNIFNELADKRYSLVEETVKKYNQ